MLNPIRLIKNLFDDEKLFDADLRSFTDDHLVRLARPANNPGGIYNALITITTTKYNSYFGKIISEADYKALAESTTINRNLARKAAEEKISVLRNLIAYKYGESSGIYEEFYPLGVREYLDAREGEIGTLFTRFVNKATAYLTADFPAEVTAITHLVSDFNAAYIARETAVADVDNTGSGKEQDRKALTLQLTTNFLTIAINNLENPTTYENYYNPAYLPISEGPQTFNGIIEKNTTINAIPAGHITRSSNLLFKNTGNNKLIFSVSDTPATIDPANQLILEAGQQLRVNDTLPPLTTYYINIQNPDAAQNGSWHIEVE